MLEARTSAINNFNIHYERIKQTYNRKNPHQRVTKKEFQYAYNVIFTRFITTPAPENGPSWFDGSGGCGSLSPLFDMLNHQSDSNCDWNTDNGVEVTTSRRIEKGEELYIFYGKGLCDCSENNNDGS